MKIAFVDIETTGLDFDIHVPIDIAVIVVDYDTNEMHKYTSCITCDAKDWMFADKKALEVNGYTPSNLLPCKKDWEVGKEIEELLVKHEIVKGKAFFLCQNPSFDRPFFLQLMSQERMNDLNMPYHWLDLASMYWMKFFGLNSSPKDCSLSKDSIAKALGLPPENKPHKALQGAEHLLLCYQALCPHSYYQSYCF